MHEITATPQSFLINTKEALYCRKRDKSLLYLFKLTRFFDCDSLIYQTFVVESAMGDLKKTFIT